MRLFIFNPEHDYALADGNPNFVAMRSAMRFSYDCASFLSCLADENDLVLNLYKKENEEYVKKNTVDFDTDDIDEIVPWGWDAPLKRHLQTLGFNEPILPSDEIIAKIRELSHRRTSSKALKYVIDNTSSKHLFPSPATECKTLSDVEMFVKENVDALFKSPYSGNGRGHIYAHKCCNPTMLRQTAGVIRRQGSIMAEKIHNVVLEFALEYNIHDTNVRFDGYSLFETKRYAYSHNVMLPDSAILSKISEYIDLDILMDVQDVVRKFLEDSVAQFYNGNCGIDMYIYTNGNKFCLQPVSEINLRRTMGSVAHSMFKTLCHTDSRGILSVLRCENKGELKQTVETKKRMNPMRFEGSKLVSGFMALNPVYDETSYALCLELHYNGTFFSDAESNFASKTMKNSDF